VRFQRTMWAAMGASSIYLNLFITLMMILVSGDSYLNAVSSGGKAWPVSFLLIGFWYELDLLWRLPGQFDAAKKAMIANRVGVFWLPGGGFHHVLGFWQPCSPAKYLKSHQIAAATPET